MLVLPPSVTSESALIHGVFVKIQLTAMATLQSCGFGFGGWTQRLLVSRRTDLREPARARVAPRRSSKRRSHAAIGRKHPATGNVPERPWAFPALTPARSLRGRARRTRIYWDLRGSSEENPSILPIRGVQSCTDTSNWRVSGLLGSGFPDYAHSIIPFIPP